jgi:hypothetical protein
MKLGLLLIAMGVGYKVYADAMKEKGMVRSLGQWVGAVIMATSLVMSALTIYTYSAYCAGKGCPFSMGGGFFKNKPPAMVAQ